MRSFKYKLELGFRGEKPILHIVGGLHPYIWIGDDKKGCYGTKDLKDMKGLRNALNEVFKEEDE